MTSDERPAPESYHSPLMHSRTLSDVDEQAVSLLGWTQEYQQLSSGKYAGAVSSLVLPEVEMIIESANRPLHQKGEIPRETVVLAFALNAGGEGWLSGKKFDKNTMLVLADGNELDFRTPPNLTVAAVVVDAKVFARHLQAIDSAASFDTAIKNRFAAIDPRHSKRRDRSGPSCIDIRL
jgi:AraC family ethanolamine operon transcriptional activator